MNRMLRYAWMGMYVICTALGTIQGATGIVKYALMVITLLFFVPPALMLYNAVVNKQRKTLLTIRVISIVSLCATFLTLLAFLIVSLLEAGGSVQPYAVNIAYYLLLAVSTPLFCGQAFFYSLFLWACLLFSTFINPDRLQKKRDRK